MNTMPGSRPASSSARAISERLILLVRRTGARLHRAGALELPARVREVAGAQCIETAGEHACVFARARGAARLCESVACRAIAGIRRQRLFKALDRFRWEREWQGRGEKQKLIYFLLPNTVLA